MMKMSNGSRVLVALVAPAICFAPGLALGFDLQGRVNTGLTSYEFQQDAFAAFDNEASTISAQTEISWSDILPFIGLGGTAFTDNGIFLDVYYQKAFSGSDSDTYDNESFRNASIDADWDRDEVSFTVGYALTEKSRVFAGFKRSETNFDANIVGTTREFGIPEVANDTPFTVAQTLDYTQDGAFVGWTHGWPIDQSQRSQWLSGVVSLNLAIAFLNGELDVKNAPRVVEGEPVPGTDAEATLEGDTIGLKIGVAWTSKLLEGSGQGPLGNGLNYTIALDGYNYDFDGDDENTADFSERVISVSVGVSAPFDL